MSCEQPICRIVTCKPTDDLPSYFGTYSLQNGTFFTNNPIVIPLPGGGYYVYKPDQITIVVPNNPTSIGYQGCQSMVSVPVPPGATDLEIAGLVSAVMREVAEQQAGCDGILIPVGPKSTWVNTRQIAICTDGPEMKLVGTLPAGVTFDISGLSVAAGIFTSKKSQQDADLRAFQYVNDALAAVDCGWWNEEQNYVCPDSSVVTVPANTYFSQISQDDANLQALTFAATQCSGGNDLLIDIINYWKLDESGGNRADSVGSNPLAQHLSTPGGAPVAAVSGIINNGCEFTGGNYITGLGTYPWLGSGYTVLTAADSFSISFWMKADAVQPVDPDDNNFWNVLELIPAALGYANLEVVISGTGATFATLYVAGFLCDSSNLIYSQSVWKHMVITVDQVNHQVICYLNGVAGTPTDITGVGLNDTPLVALGGFAAEGTWGFAGELDEIGLWKRVLTPADVTALYNSNAGLSYPF